MVISVLRIVKILAIAWVTETHNRSGKPQTCLVAVAVRAMMGVLGNSRLMRDSLLHGTTPEVVNALRLIH